MTIRVSTIYMNSVTQEAYGAVGWANPGSASDGNTGSAATCTMAADMAPATPSSYFLIQWPSLPLGYYSDSAYAFNTKKILKVEIGFYNTFTFGGLIAQNLTNQVDINNTGYQTIYTRAFTVDPVPAPLLTWVDITSITNAPAKWKDSDILNLKTRIFMASAAETADKTDI